MPQDQNTPALTRREALGVGLVALAVVALAAWRARIGVSFYDDTFYAVVPWRFAHGARFLVDELSFQTVAEMVSVPLVWLWQRIAGLTGLVLAIRLLWVALAAAGGVLATRLLRRTAGLTVAAIAVALPLLAPAYHVFAPTYNTLSSLAFTLAAVLGASAIRDRRASLAGWSGVAIAIGSAAYPPLAPAGVVLLATLLVAARGQRRVALTALGAAVVAGAVLGVGLFAGVHLADIRAALAFGASDVSRFATPAGKFGWVFGNTGGALIQPLLWPMWALAIVASVPLVPPRMRAFALALVPLAAALPGALLLRAGDTLTWGTSAQSWLVTACAALLVPSLLGAWRLGRSDLLRFVAITAPFSAVGYVTVAYVTNSSWNRGMPAIALAPLATMLVLCWATTLAAESRALLGAGSVLALLVAFALLYSNVFGDASAWQPLVTIRSGAYAGLRTGPARAAELASLTRGSKRWIAPGAPVAFLGQAEGYLATPGEPLTPATWLYLGAPDAAAMRYYDRVGRTPSAVFVADIDVAQAGGYARLERTDPFLRWIVTGYRRVGRAGPFSVFVRR